jgi:hypothetical protein
VMNQTQLDQPPLPWLVDYLRSPQGYKDAIISIRINIEFVYEQDKGQRREM